MSNLTEQPADTAPAASNAPADAAVRLEALDPSRSFIVQAPAGSGKTELLTRRVLKLLTLVDEPEEVLAITFTKKAASEMRARVVENLVFAASGEKAANAYEQEALELSQAVLQRDTERDWQLLKNVQRLNLRTVDALCTTLAHRLPFVSTLGGPAGLVEDARPLYRQAAERLLDQQAEDLDLLLLQLGNRHEHVQKLLAELLANRDQWGIYVNSGASPDKLREYLENLLQNLIKSRLEELSDCFPESIRDRLITNLSLMGPVHRAMLDDKGKDTTGAQQLADLDGSLGCAIEDLPAWSAIADALLTSTPPASLRKPRGLTRICGFPNSPADSELTGVSVDDLKARKVAMVELLEDMADLPDVVDLLDEVRRLPSGRYTDKDWALLSQLLTMLPVLMAQLKLVFAEHKKIDFVEMTQRAITALGSEDAPTDLALALDMKIKHILVDEFQDTSRTQFGLYKLLVAGWQSDDGRTFFAVGDPMQSIYRFREGDVTLFSFAREQGVGAVELSALTLTVNFRAAPAVVDWVNQTFSGVFPDAADDVTGAVPYAPSIAHLQSTGAVNIHAFVDSDVSVEAEQVALLAEQSIADPNSKDSSSATKSVAILLRSRSQAGPIFSALQARGIVYQSVDLELIGDRHVVRDLESLALALRYPHDRLHWLAVLRAPWCGLSLNDLHALVEGADKDTVFELLCRDERLQQLSADAQARVEKLLHVLTPAVKRASRGALMPWVEACWLQLGGPLVCKDKIDLDAAERCIAQLRKLEETGQLWQPSVLYSSMESLYAAPGEGDAQVQVMTLHKSKGLEFDTVILPALDRKPRGDQQKILNWFQAGSDADQQLLLAPISERGLIKKDAINGLVSRAGQLCDEQEKLRLLYVACTRAKRQLHLLARVKTDSNDELSAPNKKSLLQPLWPLFEIEATNTLMREGADTSTDNSEENLASAAAGSENEPVIVPPLLQRLPIDWTLPTFDVFQWPEDSVREEATPQDIDFLWAGTLARDIGTVVHDQLRLLSQQDEQTRIITVDNMAMRARIQLLNLGTSGDQLEKAIDKIVSALNTTLSDERGLWILNPEHSDARSEWDLSAPIDGLVKRIVIDRTFVDSEGVRWIIDYKTGDHTGGDLDAFLDSEQERYAEQLQRYADIVSRMENRTVKAALYFPLLQGWREFDSISVGSMRTEKVTDAEKPAPPHQAELF